VIRVLIVDDEAPARAKLRKALEAERDFAIVGEAGDGRAAVEAVREKKPELLFLDIQMPLLDGFGVIEELAEEGLAEMIGQVVFVTAFDDFALKAFEAQAFDYLLKPWAPSRLQKVLARVRKEKERSAGGPLAGRLEALLEAAQKTAKPAPLERLLIAREDGREVLLQVEKIDFARAAANYLELHTKEGIFRRRMTLQELEGRLDPQHFLRISRSEIVRLEAIAEVEPLFHGDSRIKLKNGQTLAWSRRYRAKVEELF
jgi:two-component system LytT family response regulator